MRASVRVRLFRDWPGRRTRKNPIARGYRTVSAQKRTQQSVWFTSRTYETSRPRFRAREMFFLAASRQRRLAASRLSFRHRRFRHSRTNGIRSGQECSESGFSCRTGNHDFSTYDGRDKNVLARSTTAGRWTTLTTYRVFKILRFFPPWYAYGTIMKIIIRFRYASPDVLRACELKNVSSPKSSREFQ